ncbi:MAG TPA: tetratricopeptide repeat protein [Sphingomicrobium sp.]|nr:tetratricopeptide repeat protein [Sphingomicrobium sp.]
MFGKGSKTFAAIGIVGAAILIAALSFRDSATRAPRSHPLAAMASLWPSHPAVTAERLLVDAALAAKGGRSLNADERTRLREMVAAAPLEPQPFMLEGAVKQLEGDTASALRLYRAARLRDPRDTAARLLLADLELRNGQVEAGLSNLVSITRLDAKKTGPVVTALVGYAQAPGAAAEMRRVFAKNRTLGDMVLMELASDPSNLPLIRALAPASGSEGNTRWQDRLVETTLAAGKPAQAKQLWIGFNRAQAMAGEQPFNPEFKPRSARPPFNWAPATGSGGLAEFRPGGGLGIVHFGREPMMLARQLILPDPGRYAIVTAMNRLVPPGRLEWRLQCNSGGQPQVVPVESVKSFEAVADCRGYWLELHAKAGETEQQVEGVVTRVELRKAR